MKLLRCNRCKAEVDLPEMAKGDAPLTQTMRAMAGWSKMKGWAHLKVERLGSLIKPPTQMMDLCEDCLEVLLEQFLVGAPVAPITTPQEQTALPHQPMLDCQLVWNPGKGQLLCRHDDPELFDALVVDAGAMADSSEGVTCDQVHEIQQAVQQMKDDVDTAGLAHSIPRRCSRECREAHTYGKGCLLDTQERDAEVQDRLMTKRSIRESGCTEACTKGHTYRAGCQLGDGCSIPPQRTADETEPGNE